MTTSRIYFDHWGARGSVKIPAYAMRQDDESDLDAVKRSIARASGLEIGACSPQGTRLEGGRPAGRHYQITLGRPVSQRYGGGLSVEGSVWVEVLV